MLTATLSQIIPSGRRFVYTLSNPCYHHKHYVGVTAISNQFEVFSRPGFTKLWSEGHVEVIKTLGIESHEYVLNAAGYSREVELPWVANLTDDELLLCLEEFEKTGDDLSLFVAELERR